MLNYSNCIMYCQLIKAFEKFLLIKLGKCHFVIGNESDYSDIRSNFEGNYIPGKDYFSHVLFIGYYI